MISDKLMILIHGSGVVRAGQWARRYNFFFLFVQQLISILFFFPLFQFVSLFVFFGYFLCCFAFNIHVPGYLICFCPHPCLALYTLFESSPEGFLPPGIIFCW